jgi:biopolymer transport protein TolQ
MFWENTAWDKINRECDDLVFSPIVHLFKSGYADLKRIMKTHTPLTPGDVNNATLPIIDYLERSMKRTTVDQGNRLDKALSFLATTGNTAPFIGLFGTVWGIMESFRGIGMKGSASLAVVAPGISEALIATAAGLAAAIPAVVAFNYFNNRVLVLKSEMETFSTDFLSLVERRLMSRGSTSKI